jgi:hypothetical protein
VAGPGGRVRAEPNAQVAGLLRPAGAGLGATSLRILITRLGSVLPALAYAFIGAVTCPVPFQAQQAEKPAGIVNNSQSASPFRQQSGGHDIERVRRPRGAADEFAEPDSECGTRCGCGKIQPLDRGDQPAVRGDDQGHVDMLVLEEGPDRPKPGSRAMRLRAGDHGIGNTPPGHGHWSASAERAGVTSTTRCLVTGCPLCVL